ncbi:hypothetical protein HDU93_001995, partial [Gonapodya sp. JEL0774]
MADGECDNSQVSKGCLVADFAKLSVELLAAQVTAPAMDFATARSDFSVSVGTIKKLGPMSAPPTTSRMSVDCVEEPQSPASEPADSKNTVAEDVAAILLDMAICKSDLKKSSIPPIGKPSSAALTPSAAYMEFLGRPATYKTGVNKREHFFIGALAKELNINSRSQPPPNWSRFQGVYNERAVQTTAEDPLPWENAWEKELLCNQKDIRVVKECVEKWESTCYTWHSKLSSGNASADEISKGRFLLG